jgi:hypothetical protein
MALLGLQVEFLFTGQVAVLRLDRAQGSKRAHFGHAPGVDDIHAVVVLESLGDGARAGRPADHHA